jgi:protein phosphatase
MRSHPGRVRRENQDACAAAPELGIYLVCDGMGGAAAGEIASHIATETFLHSIGQSASLPAEPHSHNSAALPTDYPQIRLEQAVRAANLAVYRRAQKYRALRGMGTTLVATLVHRTHTGCTAWIAHVGDSRCYLLRANNLRQLTTDHSLVEEQIQAGLLSRQEAEFSPVRNVITRAVGTQLTVPADILAHPLQSGDVLLLASDGLTGELPDAEISRILANHGADLDAACAALIGAANAHGGRDNITVLLIAAD